jgi:hypothetical protein
MEAAPQQLCGQARLTFARFYASHARRTSVSASRVCIPPEQPSDDGPQKLPRRAQAVYGSCLGKQAQRSEPPAFGVPTALLRCVDLSRPCCRAFRGP